MFIDHVVPVEVLPQSLKNEAVKTWSVSQNAKRVRRFQRTNESDDLCQQFIYIYAALVSTPVLAYPRRKGPSTGHECQQYWHIRSTHTSSLK